MKKVLLLLLPFFSFVLLQACYCIKKKKKQVALTISNDNKLQIGKKNPMILTENAAIFYLTSQQKREPLFDMLTNNRNVITMLNEQEQTPIQVAIMLGYTDSLAVFSEYLSADEKQKFYEWAQNHTNRKEILALLKSE